MDVCAKGTTLCICASDSSRHVEGVGYATRSVYSHPYDRHLNMAALLGQAWFLRANGLPARIGVLRRRASDLPFSQR